MVPGVILLWMVSMGLEIEAKMRLLDRPRLESCLVESGGRRSLVIDETNRYFDTPELALYKNGEGLRVRTEQYADSNDSVSVITHKGPRLSAELKMRHEVQVQVTNCNHAVQLLGGLGYQQHLMFEKRRHRWCLEDCLVEIDSLPQLGDFVEIEGPSESRVYDVRRQLVLDDRPFIQESYASLVAAYLKSHKGVLDSLVFDSQP